MGNCKDCKHWKASTINNINGSCKTIHVCDAVSICEYADYADITEDVIEDRFAIYAEATDDAGLFVLLKTGPNFGCVMFQSNQ